MSPSRVIERKRDGGSVPPDELRSFLGGYLDGSVEEYQMSAFLMAVYHRGLDGRELDTLVDAMVGSGAVLDLRGREEPAVDKHSTGGVGDKVSLVLAPLAAAVGLRVPMMSGRGLGHTTGTLDKLDAIPGFRTDLSLDEFRSVLDRVGCAMMGQTREIAPLDRKLYALRDVTGTVPAIPLIAASIMSKKLAEGLDGLLLDVKVGAGAFLPAEEDARELARTMVEIGAARGLETVALLTAMDRPLGRAVGNGLETAEAVRCLRGDGPPDLRELVVAEVAEMLLSGGVVHDRGTARARAAEALDSGAGLERFVRLVEAQGGDAGVVDDPGRLPLAAEQRVVEADAAGTVTGVAPRALGEGVVALGGGRRRMSDELDLAVGFELAVAVGDEVAVGDPLGTVHASDVDGARKGARILASAVRIGSGEGVQLRPLVSHRVSREGLAAYGDG